jgi:hypothetical protein
MQPEIIDADTGIVAPPRIRPRKPILTPREPHIAPLVEGLGLDAVAAEGTLAAGRYLWRTRNEWDVDRRRRGTQASLARLSPKDADKALALALAGLVVPDGL